ncbi:hypothetical protein OAG36_00150 [bacterium]|nr:hypothetical protein [bacterium]
MEKVNLEGLTDHEIEVFDQVREGVIANNNLTDFISEVILCDEDDNSDLYDQLSDIIDAVAKSEFDQLVLVNDLSVGDDY